MASGLCDYPKIQILPGKPALIPDDSLYWVFDNLQEKEL